jgi:ligand-binding sensor domain-containing protein/class 3 adenylate cyclase/predicted metal-dependent HD superfamily phosphohydrolase
MTRLIKICILLLLPFISFEQPPYRFDNYTINDGLSQSSATCIVQDNTNALWIGTQDGLNRFDGKSFEVFTPHNTEGLESGFVKSALKTEDGSLWFGTTAGLTSYDPKNERFTTHLQKGKKALSIESMALDKKGLIWLGTSVNGLLAYSTITKSFTSFSGLIESKKIIYVFVSSDNSLLINTEDKGLFRVNNERTAAEKITLPVNFKSYTIQKIAQFDNDKLLFGTNQGIFEYTKKTKTVQPAFLELSKRYGTLSVSDIYKTTNNFWYICTSNTGLITVTPSGKYFRHIQDIFQKHALLFNDINVIFRDVAGTFWIGTERGLSSFNPSRQEMFGVAPSANPSRGIPNPNVWSFAEERDLSKLYIGTDVGISSFDRASGLFDQYYRKVSNVANDEPNETSVLAIEVISKNKLLVGCSDGLFQLNINGSGFYEYKQIPLLKNEGFIHQKRIYAILKWKDGEYFVGTKAGVFYFNLNTRETQQFEHNPKDPKNTITPGACRVIYRDQQNRVWFATGSGELSELVIHKTDKKIIPYRHNNSLLIKSKDYISSICQVGRNEFWMGTFGSGLLQVNIHTGKTSVFTEKEGLPNNVIYAVLRDKSGKLWLSTNKGISCFNPQKRDFSNFTEKDGLLSNEFNIGAFLKARNGQLFFGGISGYNFFDPEKISSYSHKVDVLFTKFKFDKEWLSPGDKGSPLKRPLVFTSSLELNYRQRSFTIRFQSSDISIPNQINYKYWLEGSDEGEMFLGNSNEIRFNALSPGEYVLHVYARIREGEWGKPVTLILIIKPPFWASWWFITSALIVVAILILVVVRKRVDYERREQVRLEMKIADRTREIRTQNQKIERQKKLLEQEKAKVEEQQRLLQQEKDKTENLLNNIIPAETVKELKKEGRASARSYPMVSVLFTDFVGFTRIAERMNPSDLVQKLDVYFRKFDEIIVANGLEKIKTMGDAYMCAGGVPVRNKTNPIDTCLAALQIQEYMRILKNDAILNNSDYWELRLGINTGEVTAGVIGSQKFAYDIWGSTVNQAQRMEMLGEPGKVTITGATFKHIEPYFDCVFKGRAQSKSRGLIDMYTVERIKPELSRQGIGIYPNDRFHQIVKLHHFSKINYYKAEQHILQLLKKGLSDKLHYHSIEHTKDVVRSIERIALMEGVTDEGLFLLKTAATYHDAGFVEEYEKNEPIGARLASEILPKYGYTPEHIETIKSLIYVTQLPHNPKNKLEEIMCDADLDYLGRDDFHEIADRLCRELKEHGKISGHRAWDEIQVKFLEKHTYFTDTSKRTRQEKKTKNLEEVRLRLIKNEYLD